ncbi:hypothetical protein [Isoalcanivorax indicus]|uniref:hypothetical protein n=1 Tax=Isoalcanivorax indicus TaxID=2202653 RepID=UPI0013C4E197|nr:hypothetical protein [Isoalcanivorax indicus]
MTRVWQRFWRWLRGARDTSPDRASEDEAAPQRPPRGEAHAAHPVTDAPPEHHPGRRALKEWYTSHWDLDYMSQDEIERLQAEQERDRK